MAIDPITQNLLLGVAGNALTSLLGGVGKLGSRALRSRKGSKPKALSIGQVEGLIQGSKRLSRHEIARVQAFSSSSFPGLILRQFFANRITQNDQGVVGKIEAELEDVVSIFLERDGDIVSDVASDIFKALVKAGEQVWAADDEVADLFSSNPNELRQLRRAHDEILNIDRVIQFLSDKPNLVKIMEFESDYLRQVHSRHSYIVPPYLDAVRKVLIDNIYVSPDLLRIYDGKIPAKSVDLSSFSKSFYRAVILGNPGAGKSTLALKLIHDFSDAAENSINIFRRSTPLLVVLRDYGVERKKGLCSIVDFLESTSRARYQLNPPPKAIEYLLICANAFVVFDGLDELVETRHRREVSEDVEAFCNLYPAVPVLVTSREVGYEQAPLDRETFSLYKLGPFNVEQIGDYARKWFGLDTDLPQAERKSKAEKFMSESSSLADLRSNPLMLALMCNIYRGEGYIPRNRPDLYEKCALMLFERWDKGRDIIVSLPFEVHVRPAMMYLAYKIYCAPELQGGVTEARLITEASGYLSRRRFEDPDEAISAARAFVEFCHGRAWVFTDTGSTKDGEPLYQFTHRTFLEYFTAAYLVRTNARPSDLLKVLSPRISAGEWDVVSQLAFQVQNKNTEGAGDQLLQGLVKKHSNASQRVRLNRLAFAVRCLRFLVPKPKILRTIIESCVDEIVVDASESPVVREIMTSIMAVSVENRSVASDALIAAAGKYISTENKNIAIKAAELMITLDHFTDDVGSDGDGFWGSISERFFRSNADAIINLASSAQSVGQVLFWRGFMSLYEFVSIYGIDSLFLVAGSKLQEGVNFFPISSLLIGYIVGERRQNDSNLLAALSDLGRLLSSAPPPWVNSSVVTAVPSLYLRPSLRPGQNVLVTKGDSFFAAIVLVAIFFELNVKSENTSPHHQDDVTILEKIFAKGKSEISVFYSALTSSDEQQDNEWRQRAAAMELTEGQVALLDGWRSRGVEFVKKI